ncbi:MAG: hypothetical protein JXB38_23020 [Anaerolineales bacterium]|nr:hypothetical protein [Anaerolineales bacterium]
MNFQDFSTSKLGVKTTIGLAKALPPRMGYRFCNFIAGRIATRKSMPFVQSIRLNQWVAHDKKISGPELDRAVLEVIQHSTHCLYDLYHAIDSPEKITNLVTFSDRANQIISAVTTGQENSVIAGPHLSNFDLTMIALGYLGFHAQVLSYPNPTSGYKYQNSFREKSGLKLTPISISALKQATETLKAGGVVATGLDRPVPGIKNTTPFFGSPAYLPNAHVRLAIDCEVPVRIVVCCMTEAGNYQVDITDPISMDVHANRSQSIQKNTEKVAALVEDFIRQNPRQWLMYYPLWPELRPEVP